MTPFLVTDYYNNVYDFPAGSIFFAFALQLIFNPSIFFRHILPDGTLTWDASWVL